MSSPRDSRSNDKFSIEDLIRALDGLTNLLKNSISVSNAGKILSHLKQLQRTYQNLEDQTKGIIDEHLQHNNPKLFEALQKKSGSTKSAAAAKVFESGAIIHDSLKNELNTISQKHNFSTTTKTTEQQSDQDAVLSFSDIDTGTTRIHTGRDDKDSEHKAFLSKSLKQLDPRLYALDLEAQEKLDPLTACIEALDALRKGKENNDKVGPKPTGFDEHYKKMLLQQFGALNRNKSILSEIVLDDESSKKKLADIQGILSKEYDTVPAIKEAAVEISKHIDKLLISSLRNSQGKQLTNTTKFTK